MGFPADSDDKEYDSNMGDLGSIPELGRFPEGEHGNPFQYSCLENPHGQRILAGYGPWGHNELDTTEQVEFCMVSSGLLLFFPDSFPSVYLNHTHPPTPKIGLTIYS